MRAVILIRTREPREWGATTAGVHGSSPSVAARSRWLPLSAHRRGRGAYVARAVDLQMGFDIIQVW